MSKETTNLKLFQYDPVTDKKMTFNIDTGLNENWEKIDADSKKKADDINSVKSSLDDLKTDDTRLTKAKDITGSINELFTNANNGKQNWVDVIGSPLVSTDTFSTLKSKTQSLKNNLASNLTAKEQPSNGSESLQSLVNKVGNIKIGYTTGDEVSCDNIEIIQPTLRKFNNIQSSGSIYSSPDSEYFYMKNSNTVTCCHREATYWSKKIDFREICACSQSGDDLIIIYNSSSDVSNYNVIKFDKQGNQFNLTSRKSSQYQSIYCNNTGYMYIYDLTENQQNLVKYKVDGTKVWERKLDENFTGFIPSVFRVSERAYPWTIRDVTEYDNCIYVAMSCRHYYQGYTDLGIILQINLSGTLMSLINPFTDNLLYAGTAYSGVKISIDNKYIYYVYEPNMDVSSRCIFVLDRDGNVIWGNKFISSLMSNFKKVIPISNSDYMYVIGDFGVAKPIGKIKKNNYKNTLEPLNLSSTKIYDGFLDSNKKLIVQDNNGISEFTDLKYKVIK
ncbi:hypothetical protein [Clostridium frigidicarnis]|uniref:Uncharacterized protein n=1 Tax=Clostridium frigidicarnis TaxID=84698 RepID=A0A1I0V382_9CLOT|nr:hypothetical protein [Clostridium frigidicarnis]SFA69996.1 hypothetical protein SAMN04488528_100179 [Clostridium frigidicarnis]